MYSRRIKKLPVVLEPEEAQKLVGVPQKRYPTGLRNKVILKVMVNMGLRVSEITNLKPGDISLTKGKLRVVSGKGGVDRDLIIPEALIDLLREWKMRRPKKSNYFFPSLKGTKLQTDYLCKVVKRYGVRANIKKVISPHTLRHTFATNFYRQTKDLATLRMMLGHADISTTMIYVTLANIDVENGMKQFQTIA